MISRENLKRLGNVRHEFEDFSEMTNYQFHYHGCYLWWWTGGVMVVDGPTNQVLTNHGDLPKGSWAGRTNRQQTVASVYGQWSPSGASRRVPSWLLRRLKRQFPRLHTVRLYTNYSREPEIVSL